MPGATGGAIVGSAGAPPSTPSPPLLRVGRATLGFGGHAIRFRSSRPDGLFAIPSPHDAFLLGDDVAPDCDLEVSFGAVTPAAAAPRFDAAGHWELRTLDDGSDEVCFYGRVHGPDLEPMTLVRLEPDLRSGTIVQLPFHDGGRTFVIGFPIDEYVAGRVLARAGAVVLHATAVLDDGGAVLFAGHSGAGKSTIAKIAEDCGGEVLSDDRTIVTIDDSGAWAHGTPWHGTLKRGASRRAPVRAVYILSQAAVDEVETLSTAQALRELFVRIIQPSVDARDNVAALDTLERLVESRRVARLHFRPEASAYGVARADAARSGDRPRGA